MVHPCLCRSLTLCVHTKLYLPEQLCYMTNEGVIFPLFLSLPLLCCKASGVPLMLSAIHISSPYVALC